VCVDIKHCTIYTIYLDIRHVLLCMFKLTKVLLKQDIKVTEGGGSMFL
jgi:hypothetical protein